MSSPSSADLGFYGREAPLREFLRENYAAVYSSSEASASIVRDAQLLRESVRSIRSPLEQFRHLKDGWDAGRGIAPNDSAFAVADNVFECARAMSLEPQRTVLIPDGGIAFYFFGKAKTVAGAHRFVARLAFDNDGATTLLLDDSANGSQKLTDEDPGDGIEDLLHRVRDHVSA